MSGVNRETFQKRLMSLVRVRIHEGLQVKKLNSLPQITDLLNTCVDLFRIALDALVMHNILVPRAQLAMCKVHCPSHIHQAPQSR
jgi:hypothetical protein